MVSPTPVTPTPLTPPPVSPTANRTRPPSPPYTPPSFVPGGAVEGGSVIFAGGFVTPLGVPSCPACGASLTYQQIPFAPPFLCENDQLAFTTAQCSPKAKGMWRPWWRDFHGGTLTDRMNLELAVHREMGLDFGARR
jgi:hypothetical protein